METMREQLVSTLATRRKMFHLLFDRSIPAGRDVRGILVLDRNHKQVGTICEVHCDRETLKPRYVEIVPSDERNDRIIMYPYDHLELGRDDGPAIATATLKTLLEHEAFDYEHVMLIEGVDLVSFWTALEADSRAYISSYEQQICA